MNTGCKKEWTRKYLKTVFTGKFMNGAWKENLENLYFEREKALLPATQGVLERAIAQEKAKELKAKVKRLKSEKWKMGKSFIYTRKREY